MHDVKSKNKTALSLIIDTTGPNTNGRFYVFCDSFFGIFWPHAQTWMYNTNTIFIIS